MVEHLVEDYGLIGSYRDEVIALLGEEGQNIAENNHITGLSEDGVRSMLSDGGAAYALKTSLFFSGAEILFLRYDEQGCVLSWWTEHWKST